MSPHGPPLARFEASAGDQRATALLRGACALLAAAGASLMLLSKLPLPVFLIALLGALISVAWLAQSLRLMRAARSPERPALSVHAEGLLIEDAGRNEWLPWSDVVRIEVDEERLDIVIAKRNGATRRIEPRYSGVDLYELVRTLTRVWRHGARAEPEGSS